MAASNPTDLANLMESVSVTGTDSAAQEGVLLGMGAELAKLDLISFKVAQLAQQVEAIGKKLDVILSGPLKVAISQFRQDTILFQGGKVSDTVEMLKNVRNNAMQAFIYALEGTGPHQRKHQECY